MEHEPGRDSVGRVDGAPGGAAAGLGLGLTKERRRVVIPTGFNGHDKHPAQSIVCRNHKFACAANFVGSGDCDDANDCLAYLASPGKKFSVTVEYHTVRVYYPGSPV
jgi:hypothetical protein